MEVPLLDLRAQYLTIKPEIDEVISRVVDSQHFVLSGEVSALENEIAEYTGVKYGVGVASGTDALTLALRASGIVPGDLVITSPFTFFATAEAISVLGAIPVFVDIDPETYNIDPDKIEELLRDTKYEIRNTIKAIIPVHLYGQCADMPAIMEIAEKYGLSIIEDCAQAIGARCKGHRAGSFGNAGCISFFPSKNLGGFGDGGMVVSSEQALTDRIKMLRVHGSSEQYIHEEIGYNSRLDSLQAAVLRVKLKRLDAWFDAKRALADRYNNAFSPLGLTIPKIEEGNTHTYHQYTLALDERDGLLKHLNDNGVAARVYYPIPLHLQPCYKDLGFSEGSFPITERSAKKVVSLPVYPELSDDQVEFIIQTVKDFMKKGA